MAGARLISSARTIFAKMGPRFAVNVPVFSSHTSVPTTSAGSRSGVNWIRLNVVWMVSARVLTVRVLARPGTPSSRMWPPVIRLMRTRSRRRCCPTMRFPNSFRTSGMKDPASRIDAVWVSRASSEIRSAVPACAFMRSLVVRGYRREANSPCRMALLCSIFAPRQASTVSPAGGAAESSPRTGSPIFTPARAGSKPPARAPRALPASDRGSARPPGRRVRWGRTRSFADAGS